MRSARRVVARRRRTGPADVRAAWWLRAGARQRTRVRSRGTPRIRARSIGKSSGRLTVLKSNSLSKSSVVTSSEVQTRITARFIRACTLSHKTEELSAAQRTCNSVCETERSGCWRRGGGRHQLAMFADGGLTVEGRKYVSAVPSHERMRAPMGRLFRIAQGWFHAAGCAIGDAWRRRLTLLFDHDQIQQRTRRACGKTTSRLCGHGSE
jgi:hypothetical protein